VCFLVVTGYSGGKELDPTYRTMKDHTESVLIEFNPDIVSYEEILIEWSRMDNPYTRGKVQYRSAVFCMNDEQQEVAKEVVEGIQANARGRAIYIDVEPVTRFYRAEEYHQNFHAKSGRGGYGR